MTDVFLDWFQYSGYYSGRMDTGRKALKAGLQANNKAQTEAAPGTWIRVVGQLRWCKISRSWRLEMPLGSLSMQILCCRDPGSGILVFSEDFHGFSQVFPTIFKTFLETIVILAAHGFTGLIGVCQRTLPVFILYINH